MTSDTNLQFIREKIYQIRTAIMYSMSNELVKLPNSIVTAVKIDDEGNLWFVCNKPSHELDQCPTTFPARLHFYKKGTYFHMEVSGKAEIVNNDYKVFAEHSDFNRPVLVKMNMCNISYTEPQEKRKKSFEVWLEKAAQWMVKNIALPRNEKPVLHQMQSMNH